MIQDLIVLNSPPGRKDLPNPQLLDWTTCLRTIQIGFKNKIDLTLLKENQLDTYHGKDAYKFLLEVICGLHSPMIGETEVFGQFKNRFLTSESEHHISKIIHKLVGDAKLIRNKHLSNLGANSYGSLARKYLKDFDKIAVLGAGSLVKEILPWMKQKSSIHVYARNVDRAQANLNFKNAIIHSLAKVSMTEHENLIVAAPVTASWINSWLDEKFPRAALVLDLRDNSDKDLISTEKRTVIRLADFFSVINENQELVIDRVNKAKEDIEKISMERLNSQELRPFGWDDICA